MDEKKKPKARWEENRELIEANQMTFAELNEKYDALNQLAKLLTEAHCSYIDQVKLTSRANLGRRPSLALNNVTKLKQMLLALGADDTPPPIAMPENEEETE